MKVLKLSVDCTNEREGERPTAKCVADCLRKNLETLENQER